MNKSDTSLKTPLLGREGWLSLAVFTACQIRLFDDIEATGSEDYTGLRRALLGALWRGGYLDMVNGQYVCSDWSRKFLLSTAPWCINEYIELVKYQWSMYGQLASASDKKSWNGFHDHLVQEDVDYFHLYHRGLRSLSLPVIHDIVGLLSKRSLDRIVDLGCGYASQSLALLKAHPEASLSLVDHADVFSSMTELTDNTLSAQIHTHVQGILDYCNPKRCDLTLLCNVVHLYNDEIVSALLQHVRDDILRPGGHLLLQDFGSLGEECTEFQDLFASYMFLHSGINSPDEARTYSNIEELLLDAGYMFELKRQVDCATPTYLTLWKAP